MGYHTRRRVPSPGTRRMTDPARASTGTVPYSSSFDAYDLSGRYGHSAYSSDAPYPTNRRHDGHSHRLEAQPVSSKMYRDPGHSKTKRTEYAIRPKHSGSTSSNTDVYQSSLRPPGSSLTPKSPTITSSYPRSVSPRPREPDHYVVPASSRHPHHRRLYSSDYASDTGRLDPKDALRHRPHGTHRVYAPSRPRYVQTGGFNKGGDIDDHDAYSYTGPREQFESDSAARSYYREGRRGRPTSMAGLEEYQSLPKESRAHGPPPSQRGLDRIERDHRVSRSVHPGDGERARYLPVSVHQGRDEGYSSYREDYDSDRHRHRSRRRYDDRPRHSHDFKSGYPSDLDYNLKDDRRRRGHDHSRMDERERRDHDRPRRTRRSDSDASDSDNDRHRHEQSRRRHDSSSDDGRPSNRLAGHPRRRRSYSRHRDEDGPSQQGSSSGHEDSSKAVTIAKEPPPPPKGILKTPREKFPEESNPVREGVAPLKDANRKGIPEGARWTKIDRNLVNPAALEAGRERFEERSEYVIVLRVLSKEEIQAYAVKTQEIRGTSVITFPYDADHTDARYKESTRDRRQRQEEDRRRGPRDESSSDDEEEDDGDDEDDAPFAMEAIAESGSGSGSADAAKHRTAEVEPEPASEPGRNE